MDIRKINLHEHKTNPKYGNIKSYINRCKKLLNGSVEIKNTTPLECLDIIEDTLISLEKEHEIFIKSVTQSMKDEQ